MCILCEVMINMPPVRAKYGLTLVQQNHEVNRGLISIPQARKILINHKFQPIEADAIIKYWIETP